MKNRHREKMCRRCGECCRLKREVAPGVFVVDGDKYCPRLEWLPDGRAFCSVYHLTRPLTISLGTEETTCVTADALAKMGVLPESCPYAQEIPNYRCRVIGYKESGRIAAQLVAAAV